MRLLPWLVLLVPLATAACGDDGDNNPCSRTSGPCTAIPVGATTEAIQTAFINAQPGDTIGFGAGTYVIDRDLSLTVDNVTLAGAGSGSDGTILSFATSTGAQGILITGDQSRVEHLGVEDTPGDAIKWEGSAGVVASDVRVEWLGPPKADNGAYGLYPVQCQDVLIDTSKVRGASDAGIYVGQSDNIIVRNNVAEENVAGIEIENSTRADVYGNLSTHNTGGLLVFSLPGLQVHNGAGTRVYDNQILDNNTPNFAPAGNIVGLVPTGTGIALLAGHQVEIFDNDIANHKSIHIGIVGYNITMRPFTDTMYNPYSDSLYIHDNRLVGKSLEPSGPLGFLLIMGMQELGRDPATAGVSAIVWDGDVDPAKADGNGDLMSQYAICIKGNSLDGQPADFANLRVPLGNGPTPTTDLAPHDCTLPALPAVTLP
ncbi:MAG: parallel beta-helix domain-containing protein [Kofleriaceae bacterium]